MKIPLIQNEKVKNFSFQEKEVKKFEDANDIWIFKQKKVKADKSLLEGA